MDVADSLRGHKEIMALGVERKKQAVDKKSVYNVNIHYISRAPTFQCCYDG